MTHSSTPKHLQLLAISGSLRAASSNTAVLQALQLIAPDQLALNGYAGLADLPYFNPDLDGEGDTPPAAVAMLRAAIGAADGLLISSPEYAHGVPGVLKNALDWLVSSREFPGKPVALINVAPRATFVHAALAETLRTMSAALIDDPALTFALPRRGMDAAALAQDPLVAARLQAVLAVCERAIRAAEKAAATR